MTSAPLRDPQAAELGALKAEEQSSKSKLEQKLAARRQKKTEELRKKEERQLKEKAARDAKRLEVRKTISISQASPSSRDITSSTAVGRSMTHENEGSG